MSKLDKQALVEARDRLLKNWRVAKGPEKRERIGKALDLFIDALQESVSPSIPVSTLEPKNTPDSRMT
ncbi:MAG: hypothetical protein PUP92_00925 [Rhizonema sp. PD38]|nr:hypothetical protein [Rhizonema sp. PD38]